MWRCFLIRHLGSLTHALCSQTDYMRDVNCPENKYGWKRPSAVRHRWLLMLTHWGHWGESEYGLDGKFFSRNKNVWIGDIEVFESNLLANVRFTPDLSSKEVSVSQSKPLFCHPFVFFFVFSCFKAFAAFRVFLSIPFYMFHNWSASESFHKNCSLSK